MISYNEFWATIIKILFFFAPPRDYGALIRGKILSPFLKGSGKKLMIPWRTYVFNPNLLSVGDNVYLGYNSYYGQGSIKIGSNVLIGPFVSITATNHVKGKDGSFRNEDFSESEVVIEDNVWIGGHVSVLAGVHIGCGSIVAAGSIVTKNVPNNVVVAGIPAKVIKEL
jgi:maltose O-acetyltransferase